MMKRYIIIALALAALLCGCGRDKTEKPAKGADNSSVQTEAGAQTAEEEKRFTPVTDEETVAQNRAVISQMLNSFQSLDYDGALECIRESDRSMLDVESAKSNAAYQALLPRMTYETGDSLTDAQGGRYIDVSVTAPSMADIYGQVFIRLNDAMMSGEITSDEEAAEFNNKSIAEVAGNSDIRENTMDVRVELVEEDGGLRAVFTPELLNAMLGDIQNAASQIDEAVGESVDEYNQAKAAGEFD